MPLKQTDIVKLFPRFRPLSILHEIRYALLMAVFVTGFFVVIPGYLALGANGPKPIVVTEKRSLSFASVAGSSEGPGTVKIAPNSNKKTTGYAIDMGGNPLSAKFRVTGDAGASVVITLPTTAQITNGATNITLRNFKSNPSGTATLNSKGKLTIKVGATMDVPANLSSGSYNGSFTIYVDAQ